MSDHSELKRLAEAATPGPWAYDGSYVCPARTEDGTTYVELWRSIADCHQPENTKFIAAANPAAVLALIAENERYLKLVERMVDQYVPLTELEGVPGWSRVVELVEVVAERDRLKTEVEGLRAQHGRNSAELRSLSQARDDARKERDQLKAEVDRLNEDYDKEWRHDLNDKNNVQVLAAEVEALRKDAERYRWLREKVGVDLIFGDYSPWLLSCNTDMTDLEKKTTDEAIDAAMTKGSKP